MRRILRQPPFWIVAVVIWFGVLWWLSSRSNIFPPDREFQANDKVLHFGYFFGGGILLSGLLHRLGTDPPRWRRIFLLTLAIGSFVGALDEHHQSYVPGRSAHDPADFTADVLGIICGAWIFRKTHRLIA
ncbi:VanZ family protein [Luteolibacter marinus]|uniref:VanZ family protein n=1 Tax=Luteolibacter marinus TaxID=2776705 RepID=UPI00186724A9|nr:VanZ family protein [Luteolibacter marinus]